MYQVINNLPIDYDFQSKTKEELKLYAKWFEENKESRLQELIKAVKTTKGYENWEADYSPESLKMLGKWFEENVETEKLSEEEYKEKRAAVPDRNKSLGYYYKDPLVGCIYWDLFWRSIYKEP